MVDEIAWLVEWPGTQDQGDYLPVDKDSKTPLSRSNGMGA